MILNDVFIYTIFVAVIVVFFMYQEYRYFINNFNWLEKRLMEQEFGLKEVANKLDLLDKKLMELNSK